jgi:hypothetical protein
MGEAVMDIKEDPVSDESAERGEDEQETKLPSQMEDDDLFELLKGWYKTDYKANSQWYSEAFIDYGFEAGDQWKEDEVSALDEADKLHVTMNRVKPTVDVICGMEVTNRQEVQYIPRTTTAALPQVDPKTGQPIQPNQADDDAEVSEGYTEVARWARDNCDAEDEESDSFRDVVICGMAWTNTEMDYESEPDGKIVISRLDPLDMGWDSTSTKRNLDDAKRYSQTKRDISANEAKSMFPDFDLSSLHAGWAFESKIGEGFDHDRELARNYGNKNINNEQRTKVTMVIMQWCEIHTEYEVINPADGQPLVLDAKKFRKIKKAAKEAGQELTHKQVKSKKWMQATLGNKVLEVGPGPCDHSSSFRCITGYRDRNKRQWYGIVRPMRDPQKWANKFFSVALEQIATSGKGLMAEQNAFVDDKQAEREWAKTGNIAWLKTGAIGKVLPKPQPPLLTGLAELMQLSLSGIRDVTGVNQETLGNADRDQAASLEYQRRQAGVTILAAFFDNLRRYRKEQGRVLLYFIQNYISDGRIVRIVGETGPKFLQLMKQEGTIQYDIIVDQAASSPNQKEASWMVTKDLLPLMMQNGAPPSVMLEVLKASPLPESSVQKIKRAFERSQAEQKAQGPSMEEQKLGAEVKKITAEAEGKQLDAQLKQQELQVRGMEAQMGLQTTQLTLQDQAAQRDHDMQIRGMDMQAKQSEIDAKQSEEAMKTFGKDFPDQVNNMMMGQQQLGEALVQSQTQLAQALMAIAQGQQQLAQGQQALAQAMLAPKVAQLAPDGLSATVAPMVMQ